MGRQRIWLTQWYFRNILYQIWVGRQGIYWAGLWPACTVKTYATVVSAREEKYRSFHQCGIFVSLYDIAGQKLCVFLLLLFGSKWSENNISCEPLSAFFEGWDKRKTVSRTGPTLLRANPELSKQLIWVSKRVEVNWTFSREPSCCCCVWEQDWSSF